MFGGVAGAFIVYAMFEVASFPVNAPIRFTEILGTPNAEIFYAFMGLAIAIVSQIGDIFASKVKREFGVKDFSTLLGSHGGIIDRIDSIIFAVLFVAVVVEFLPVAVAL